MPLGQTYPRPDPITAPSFLDLSSQQTPLQQRSQIATFGVAGGDPRYRVPAAIDYYKNIALRSLIGEKGEIVSNANILPIERQYLGRIMPSFGGGGFAPDFLAALLGLPSATTAGQTTTGRGPAVGFRGDGGMGPGAEGGPPDFPFDKFGEYSWLGKALFEALTAVIPGAGTVRLIGGRLNRAFGPPDIDPSQAFGFAGSPEIGGRRPDQRGDLSGFELGPSIDPAEALGFAGSPEIGGRGYGGDLADESSFGDDPFSSGSEEPGGGTESIDEGFDPAGDYSDFGDDGFGDDDDGGPEGGWT